MFTMNFTIFLKLTIVCIIFFTVSTTFALTAAINAVHAIDLLSRASNSCDVSNYLHCNLSELSSTFCCSSGSTCVQFNNAAFVVCCSSGQDCKNIAFIFCDISQQNVVLFSSNSLHSIDLKRTLQVCESGCCSKTLHVKTSNAS